MTRHDPDLDVLGPVDYVVVEFSFDEADFSARPTSPVRWPRS
jgi:hypothetical protein